MNKKLLVFTLSIILIVGVITGCKIQSVDSYNKQHETVESSNIANEKINSEKPLNSSDISTNETGNTSNSAKDEKKQEGSTSVKKTDNTAEEKAKPAPEKLNSPKDNPSKVENKKYVTITIRCDTILKNWDKLDKPLQSDRFVPQNGVILKETKYEINDGDTVFDILVKATRQNRIHMQYQGANMNQYGSVYVQGINNLYEFSCGKLSGWMYCVNDWYPNYGCSKYALKNGDVIKWNYTCDLGRDLGVFWLDE